MAALLQQRYGFQEYYTGEQVLTTYKLSGLDPEGQDYAVALFVQPEMANGFLSKIANSKTAEIVRTYMVAECFGLSGGHYSGSNYNPFMHHDTILDHHHVSGSFDGSSGHHASDSGHSHGGGDSGGGHH